MYSQQLRVLRALIIVALWGAAALTAHANVLITQQGRLTDASGAPLPDGNYEVLFCITTLGAPIPLWAETQTVSLEDGLFSVTLGTVTPLDESNFKEGHGATYIAEIERYLVVKVAGYPDLPQVRMTGVPYAAVATRMTGDVTTQPGELKVSQPGESGTVFINPFTIEVRNTAGQDLTILNAAGLELFSDPLFPSLQTAGFTTNLPGGPGGPPSMFIREVPSGPGNDVLITPEGMGCDFDQDGNWNLIFDEIGTWADLGDDQSAEVELYTFSPNMPHAPAFLTTAPNVQLDFLGRTNFGSEVNFDLCPAVPGFEIKFKNPLPAGCNGALASFSLPVDIVGNVTVTGNQTVSGTKSFVQDHPTLPDKQIVYVSLEGNEAGTYTRGSGRLTNGFAEVTLPEDFGFVTNAEGLTAQITPRGPVQAMLYVESVTPQRLVVRASSGADNDVPFDFLVQGVRLGYENHQVIRDKLLSPAPEDIKQTPPSLRRSGTFGTPGR